MNVYFAHLGDSLLAAGQTNAEALMALKPWLLGLDQVCEVQHADHADAILLPERVGYKDWRYRRKLLNDPFIAAHLHRLYTLNQDDGAHGLLKGAYTSLPTSRLDPRRHVVIPYPRFPNAQAFTIHPDQLPAPTRLASWRGNTKSAAIRRHLLAAFSNHADVLIETSSRWLDHGPSELKRYVEVIGTGKFSLCPRGFSPMTYRLYESMALGRVPVVLADDLALPEGPSWAEFVIQIPEHEYQQLPAILQQYEHQWQHMGQSARQAWERYFNADQGLASTARALHGLIRRNLQQPTHPSEDRARCRAWSLAWSNGWTLPQRLSRQARRRLRLERSESRL